MTSTNDGKDVKSNQTSGQKAKTYYIELYKSLEARLTGECTGEQRTRLVCEAWRRIHGLCQHSAPKTHPHLLTWLQRHTSHTILQTEWQSPKSKDQHSLLEEAIDAYIGECQVARDAHLWETQLLHRGKWFKTILSNPWGHPVLKALLDSTGPQPTNDEVLGWLKEEKEVMFVTRLRQLAASKCDDLALLLTSAVMIRARDCSTAVSDIDQAAGITEQSHASKSEPSFVDILREEAGFTEDVWELLTDIEFVLLHKGESRSRCIELAKQTPLRNGPMLVERLKSRLERSPRDKKLWKNAKDVATLIAQVVIARCMVVPTCNEAARVALYGCTRALVRLLPVDKLPPAAAALAAPAATSRHLYILATAVDAEVSDSTSGMKTCKDERKSFVCELFVRAITAGMNELERLKLKTEKESEARSAEETLSTWFIQLGTLLSTSSRMNYECVLTAFSIHPSSSMYKRVEEAPPLAPILKDTQEPRFETNSEFGSWATDSRTQTNFVKTSETLNLKQTQTQANVLSTAIFAEGEALGLGAELCQDLAVLISGPRVKTLSWDMDRELLLDSCRKYMERRHGGTRALTTELKYLNLDPRSYQHLPEEVDNENDAFYGIEKGYEHLVEFQESEELWQDEVSDDNKKTDSAYSGEELPIIIPRRKKKSKKLKYFSDEETDPLSFGENSKRSEKKERPHSKERSKDRKERKDKYKIKEDPTHETEQIKEQGYLINQETDDIRMKEKKKERRERKKKDKAVRKLLEKKQQKPPQSGPLARLVGMKVARISDVNKQLKKSEPDTNVNNNLCITDSDYDSQGKSSLNSEANDHDVLFDGLYSMDEIKSPEKSIDIIQRRNSIPKLEELRASNGILNNSLSVPAKPFDPIQTQSYQLNINPKPKFSVHTNTKNNDKEEVKRSIKKLIEFRRNKNSRESPTKPDVPILNPNLIEQKTPIASSVKSIETPSQIQYKEFLKHRSQVVETHPQVSNVIDTLSQKQLQHVREPPKIVSNSRSNLNNANVTPEIIHRDFIKQSTTKKPQILQTNSDKVNVLDSSLEKPRQCPAKGIKNIPGQSTTNVDVPTQNHCFIRDLKTIANAGASKKSEKILPVSDKIYSPKQGVQQKKVDIALNTFSRLSYMHKNKQNDGKNKVIADQIKLSNSSTANNQNLGLNIDKVSHLQSKGELIISRVDKSKTISKDITNAGVQKIQNIKCLSKENPLCLSIQHPVMPKMLFSDSKSYASKAPKDSENRAILHKNTVTPVEPLPNSTYPSESDKRDLLLLLRQRSKMNPPKKQHKTENPKVIIDNSSTITTTIKPTSKSNINDIRPKEAVVNDIIPNLGNSKTLSNISVKVPNNKLTLSEQKKVQNVKGCGKNPKQTVKINEASSWESVMDAILAHKTPSRGPNALDITLKKDSFENRSSNNMENQNTKTNHTSTDTKAATDSANLKKLTTQSNSSVVSSGNIILPNTHTIQPQLKLKQEKNICSKDKNIELGRSSPLDLIDKCFPGIIQNTNDPFISGIPNSDYDLLEELMDDDLRKEIGELMSDEEAYGTLTQTPRSKNVFNDKPVNSFLIKYPNQKLNMMTAEKTATTNSKLDLQNKNIIITPKSTIDVPLDCNALNNPVLQINCNKNTLFRNNANEKPRIISNEIITSPIINQPGNLKIGNVVQQFKTTVTPENNNLNKNVDRNTMSTSSTLPNACIKAKIEDLPVKEVQRTNTENLLHSKNIALDPTRVILTVPPRNVTPNFVLIGNELICDSFSTVKVDQSNVNTYVPVNRVPNLTLYRATQFVAPCANPVVIGDSTTLPVAQMVSPNISIISCANTNLKSMNSETEKNMTCAKFHEENKVKTGNCQGNKQKIEVPKCNNEKSENKIDISNTFCGMPEKNKNLVCPNSIEISNVVNNTFCGMPEKNKNHVCPKRIEISNVVNNTFCRMPEKNKNHVCPNSIENSNVLNRDLESIQSNNNKTKLSTKESTKLSKLNSIFDTNHDITENNKLLKPAKKIEKEISYEQVKQSLLGPPIPEIKLCQENNQHRNKKYEQEERDRLQNKRMQIINRQTKHNIYEKPIALSYKSLISMNNVHKSDNKDKGLSKNNVLDSVIYDNKKISSEYKHHNKSDNEKPNIDTKKKTTSLQKNVDLNICEKFCQKSSDTSTSESSINDSSITENSIVYPPRRISLRLLNDSMALTSPKPISVAIKSKVKPKHRSLLKKRLPIQKPVIAKVLKKIPEKSKEMNSLKQFGKQMKRKIKSKKSNLINVETEVSTIKSHIENIDSVSRTIEKLNYTCVDIEEQITSAIIPNIFIEKNNIKKTPENKLNSTEENPTSSIDKDAIDSNLKGNVESNTKMIKFLHKEIEKNVEKEKLEINIIDANNTKTINQSTAKKLNTTENHPKSPMDKDGIESNLKENVESTTKMMKSPYKEIVKNVEKEKPEIHIIDANNTNTINQSTENKLNKTENHPTSNMDKDGIESNLTGNLQSTTKMMKSLYKELDKNVGKEKPEINMIDVSNTKTINQSTENKLNTTESHPTSPKDKDSKKSNLKVHAQCTTTMIKPHHKEIKKSVKKAKHGIHIIDANKNTKTINQSAENKLKIKAKHPKSSMDKDAKESNLKGHAECTTKMIKPPHKEMKKSVKKAKHGIHIIDANKNTKTINQSAENKLKIKAKHPKSSMDKDAKESNLKGHAECTTKMIKPPHKEMKKSVMKAKHEIHIMDANKNTKTINQSAENKLKITEKHPTSSMDKNTKESNLRGHVQSTNIMMKSLHKYIEKCVEKEKHEIDNICANRNTKTIYQSSVSKSVDSQVKPINNIVSDESSKSTIGRGVGRTTEIPQIIEKCKQNSDIQTGQLSNESIDEKLLECKSKIIIEEIPTHNKDPLKKIVRIKLPNGNTFKATISGQLNTNVDSLFKDPAIKDLLWKNINNNTKCTLNIKQVAIKTASKCESVVTKVQDISYVHAPVISTETINLVSDDEDSAQTFKTEFGNYDIAFMNPDLFLKHQKRFSQKCTVKLERCSIFSKIKKKSKENSTIILCESNKDINSCTSPQQSSLQERIANHIEIDDFSNESVMTHILPNTDKKTKLTENIDDLKNLLLKDFGVEDSTINLQNSFNEPAVDSLLHKNITTDGSDEERSKQCLLRIEKCDELVEKMQIQKNMCFVSLARCDDTLKNLENISLVSNNSKAKSENKLNSEESMSILDGLSERSSTMKRTGSLSILNDFLVLDESKSIDGSPQIQNHDLISIDAALFSAQPQNYLDRCSADWLMTKYDLHRYYHNNVHTIFGSEFDVENLKYEDVSTDCDSDFEISTSINAPNIKNDNICDQEQIKYEVPSLIKIIVNYLINNSNIIEDLRSICQNNDTQPIASSSPLKRKLTGVADNKNRKKILKIENVLSQSCDGINKILSHNELVSHEESFSLMEIVDNKNFQNKLIVDREKIDESISHKNNDNEILSLNEIDTKKHSDTFHDNVNMSGNKLNVDLNDSVLNTPNCHLNISFKKKSSKCFQKEKKTCLTVNNLSQTELSTEKPDEQIQCHNESKPTSIFTVNNLSQTELSTEKPDEQIQCHNESKPTSIFTVNNLSQTKLGTEKPDEQIQCPNESKPTSIFTVNNLSQTKLSTEKPDEQIQCHNESKPTSICTVNNLSQTKLGTEKPDEQIQCHNESKPTSIFTVNNLSQTKLSTEKPDEQIQCHNESKPTSIFTDDAIETRKTFTECSDDEDKIEVIIPSEKLDDKNIQSLPLNSTNFRYNCLNEEPTTDGKSNETKLNRFEGNYLQEVDLNTDNNIKKGDIIEPDSNSVYKNDIQTINSNKVLDDIILNKNAEMFCEINNLQKQNNQEYSINENKNRESDNTVLKNKNNDVIDKELQHNIDVEDKDTKTSVVCKSLQNELITKSSNDALQKNVTLVYKGDSSVVLKGSIYEDPVVGTCYVFPILNKTSYDGEISCSNICDEKTINVIQALKNKVVEDQNDEFEERENSYNLDVTVPKITYSRQRIQDNLLNQNTEKLKRKTLKRKSDAGDNKLNGKRYRKGKNIDYPKITVTAMAESSYTKEYKRLFNYCSSIKFSFSRPFHKEYVDVSDVLKCWPIRESTIDISDTTDDKSVLFLDENVEKEGPYDPLQQTLAEEISSKYVEQQLSCDQINENNFSMGFGEGSGRVINISEDGDNISKFSAATLSDVKQSQPFLLSEDYEENTDKCVEICKFNKDQFDIFKRYVSYIQLRDKVRSFFKKTTLELNYHWLKDNLKNTYKMSVYNNKSNHDFPYDLVNPDFIEPAPVQAVVQVVQVGQLPVSAAAQNPVTCDPRVTQVTDASPSLCSVENSPQDDSQSPIKTEYTELTTADLSLPLVQEYERHMKSQESSKVPTCNENIPVEMEVTDEVEHEELPTIKDEPNDYNDSDDLQSLVNKHINNVEYSYDSNANNSSLEAQSNNDMMFETLEKHNAEFIAQQKQQNGSAEKTDQIAHAMNAAGITTTSEIISNQRGLVNIMSPKMGSDATNHVSQTNNYSKPAINAISLQQALAQILPPPLNQNNSQDNNQTAANSTATSQVLHIVQGKNSNGSQLTLVDNTQNSVINNSNTSVLHIVQNKGVNNNCTSNTNAGQHSATYGGLSLVETGLQQGNNQLLHIVNTGNQKNPASGQLLKRVNLLTNLSNVQGTNDQKMVQFLCKAADGKSIQLNASNQRSMVLRLQPIESSNIQVNQKSDSQDLSPSGNTNITTSNKESANAQHEIKSRSVYEENYAKFIQSSTNKSLPEKSTSLPKFNQAFGKQVFQDGNQKSNDINSNTSHLPSVNLNTENPECQSSDATLNLDHMGQINSPPLLLRKTTPQTTQSPSAQPNLMQQIKQTISPMNIQTMHGGVIYTRQIPVNIGGGQTINLITVPSTELIDENSQKQQNDVKFVNQNEIDSPIIKIVPQNQTSTTDSNSDESLSHLPPPNENSQNTPTQHQPVLTQMRIKLPMLSKAPQMVSGTRVVRPSFFQIQRNVIGGANQPVYQQLVLTAAPPLGHTIRLPQTQTTRQVKLNSESQSSSESQMSSSTLEQLREFDMVLEQVKERSTVQPNPNVNNTYTKLNTPKSEATDTTSITSTVTESTQQVLYSIGSNQSVNVAYVSRKPNATTPTQSAFVRSPDSSGIIESPSSSTHVQIPHTVTSETSSSEGTAQPNQQKAAKVGSKSKSRPKSSHPPNSLKINTVPPKTSTQKPLEDEQTTQRILYILAEYKEQVENSPDKDKPAPRRRSNPPSNPSGSSKRKKSSSSSRRSGGRDMSPVHGDETCRTMGSEDSSCGTSQGDCTENCLETHSPQDSPHKVVRKLSFENETNRPRPQPQRNVIVADGQTITVARGTAGKPTTAVLMPANYILPVSMVKGGQQIAIVTNRGPKLLTVGGGEGGATNALLLQRLIGPAGLKPVLARPGVRHVRLPTAALHNLQAFNLATATTIRPPDSTASPASAPTQPELIETRAASSPWTDRESQDIKPERGSSPEDSEPWNLPSSADPHDYTYEETVRTDNMDRTVLDAIPDRYSPEMEAQRIFDKMFDVDSKRSYIVDSQDDTSRCAYDIDASDSDDKAYHQVVQRKDGSSHRQHRLTHVSAAALRHKYAILEHELRLQGTAFLQKSLSEECEDLGVDSPSASELFPEAELLFAASPAHDAPQHSHTPQPTIINQSGIPQPDIDDQIATDRLIHHNVTDDQQDLGVTLGLDEGIVTVSEDGMQATIALDQEEFARSHPNTTFHSEPTDEGEVQPFTITGLKGRHITPTIFHAGRAPATVLVTAPQTSVISQATPDNAHNNVKFANINQIINSSPVTHGNLNLSSLLVKDDRLTKFDNILTDSRELHLSHTASAIVHSTGNATQVIRRVCYEDDKRDTRFLMDEPEAIIAGDDAKMVAEDSSRDATLESMAGEIDDDNSSPERHAELFWESNSASERSESRRPLDFSSDSEKCCKSPSYDETNSTDSSGVGTHMRLDSVIKDARGIERSGSAEGSSADDTHPPLRTYPAKRMYHTIDREMERSMSGKTRAGFQEERSESLEVRRRASNRGVVKRGCHCCNGSPAPSRPKKSRQRKPTMDFTSN